MDVLIELLHALGFEPIAALPFTLRIDFEGDQWTFFKFPHADLFELYGIDVHELNPWHGLVRHVDEQVGRGRPVLVELDSFYLPDTRGTAYHAAHVKSTVAVNEIDVEKRHLGYFHGQGYHHLDGDDFVQVFQLDGLVHERMLPPYIEYLKPATNEIPHSRGDLLCVSRELLRRHVRLLPTTNPFQAFQQRLRDDLAWLAGEPLSTFHAFAFATLRQYGACFELVETYLRWLADGGERGLDEAIDAFRGISTEAKTFQFQVARAMGRRRELSLEPLDGMADLWGRGMAAVTDRYP